MEVRRIEAGDAAVAGDFVHRLLTELAPDRAAAFKNVDFADRASRLLAPGGGAWGFLALDDDGGPLGALLLGECSAIYAGGAFGVITELYVLPERRSEGVAPPLLEAARAFAHERGWTHLEVTAPPLPEWRRTVDFYRRNGFIEIGPRLKRTIE